MERVQFRDLRITSLLFVVDVVLLDSTGEVLQPALRRFAAECEAVGMRVSTSTSEVMVLCWKKVVVMVMAGLLPQREELKYLGLLHSEGKMEREIDR